MQWLMFLLDETDGRIIFLTTKILVQMLVVHGPAYVKRFAELHGGFTILRQRLKTWWNMPAVWTLCLALMFGVNPNTINFEDDFNHFALADIFSRRTPNVMYPETLSVLTGMLEHGLRAILQDGYSMASSSDSQTGSTSIPVDGNNSHSNLGRDRSMSLNADKDSRGNNMPHWFCCTFANIF
jgi:hypothetical protein